MPRRRVPLPGLLFLLCALAPLAALAAQPEPRRSIELAFAIDATGSMSGFIEGAKRRVWSIARQVARPGVDLRLGLVAYRDRGDAFVTRVVPMGADLDGFDHALREISAGGGGDTPEAVNRALADAVSKLGWSEGDVATRWLILVGDAPPHAREAGEVPYLESVARARRRGIVVHAIQCGRSEETARAWRAIARRGGGEYRLLDPAQALPRTATPFDTELVRAGRALAETIVATGDAETRRALRERRERVLAADAETTAERLDFLERRGRSLGEGWGDLVSRAARGDVDPSALPPDAWPDSLREASPADRRQWLEDQIERRRGLFSEIAWLARQREKLLREREAARRGDGESERFEALVRRLMETSGAAGARAD
ncbi:MAG: vWA domain-containing protein [Myxococcota bacterium]